MFLTRRRIVHIIGRFAQIWSGDHPQNCEFWVNCPMAPTIIVRLRPVFDGIISLDFALDRSVLLDLHGSQACTALRLTVWEPFSLMMRTPSHTYNYRNVDALTRMQPCS